MPNNFPYTSSDYFSEKYQPFDLTLQQETLSKTEHPHYRDEIEYLYICQGSGAIEINHMVTPVSEGDFIQLMPYHVHRFLFQPKQTLTLYRIRFSIGLLLYTSTNQKNYLKSIHNIENAIPIVHLTQQAKRRILFMCQETLLEKQQYSESLEALHVSFISFISYIYYKHQGQLSKSKQRQCLDGYILQYIHLHHQEPLTLKYLSTQLGLTEGEIKHQLLQLTGQSFQQVLHQVRLRNAVALIQFEELSINQIAKICGYASESLFYKKFHETYGVRPQDIRHKLQDNGQIATDAFEIILTLLEEATQPVNIQELAQKLNFSEKKINYLLKQLFHMNVKEWSNYLKVTIAKNLLVSLPLSAEEISQRVGFTDPLTFSRNFKKVYGVTPTQYRKNKGQIT